MNRYLLTALALGFAGTSLAAPDKIAVFEAKAKALVAKMTLEEKRIQLVNNTPGIPRIGLAKYAWWNEALHGIARNGRATVFPEPIGQAASFNPALVRRVAEAIVEEGRAKYAASMRLGRIDSNTGLTYWSPNVNIFRDPRWGRGHETFGEDPYLTGRMGVTFVKGLQGDDPNYLMTSACAKHYAVHSGPESKRHEFNVNLDRRDLYEYSLASFKPLVVEAKVDSVMGAYSAVNGIPCCCNKFLLREVLRDEWGFKGHIVSDVGACADVWSKHKYVTDRRAATFACLAGGLDLCNDGTFDSRCTPSITKSTRKTPKKSARSLKPARSRRTSLRRRRRTC